MPTVAQLMSLRAGTGTRGRLTPGTTLLTPAGHRVPDALRYGVDGVHVHQRKQAKRGLNVRIGYILFNIFGVQSLLNLT